MEEFDIVVTDGANQEYFVNFPATESQQSQSIEINPGEFQVMQSEVPGTPIPQFSGDCTGIEGQPFIAIGTIDAGQDLTCTITENN